MGKPIRTAVTWQVREDEIYVAGSIDERADMVALVAHAKAGKLALDLAGVTFINSIGVREWIRMMHAAAAAKLRVELRRVTEPIVHQLNIVPAARGASIVSSFFAPYACDHCDREDLVLIEVAQHGRTLARQQAPAIACDVCHRPMVFGEPPELYLGFLK